MREEFRGMQVAVVGAGYVGLVSGTCLAEMGNQVVCLDSDEARVAELRAGRLPLFEPGLPELVASNVAEGRLTFSSDPEAALGSARVVLLAVGTPSSADGSADLAALWGAVERVALEAPACRLLAIKSTVPVGTCARVQQRLGPDVAVVSNPEFLKQGDAVQDFLKPDRVIVGSDDAGAVSLMRELYAPFMRTTDRMLVMDPASAEMTKYAANAFLATKISFINEISRICAASGADVEMVRQGLARDHRIGAPFLFPGLGYGGSCFPKDVRALIALAEGLGTEVPLLRGTDSGNARQRSHLCDLIAQQFPEGLRGQTVALWGLAFKPRTDDLREAPALAVLDFLLERGASVRVFDPRALDRARALYGEQLLYAASSYQAAAGAQALVIATEWNEFRRPDFARLRDEMARPLIVDGRNLYDPAALRAQGWTYLSVGRPS